MKVCGWLVATSFASVSAWATQSDGGEWIDPGSVGDGRSNAAVAADAPMDAGSLTSIDEVPRPSESSVPPVERQDIEDVDLETLLGTVASVSRREESLVKSPTTVTVLNRDEIARVGALTIPDLLKRIPGVQVYRTAAGNQTLSLRGMGGLVGNNVVVVLDGIPLNSPVDASVDWGGIPVAMQDLERIEIVRGPVSTIYGANAYTGVISLVTSRATGWSARGGAGADLSGRPVGVGSGRVGHQGSTTRWAAMLDSTWDNALSATKNEAVSQPPLQRVGGWFNLRQELSSTSDVTAAAGASIDSRSASDFVVLEAAPAESYRVLATARYMKTDLASHWKSVELWIRGRWFGMDSNPAQYKGFSSGRVRALDGQFGVDSRFSLSENWLASAGIEAGLVQVTAPFLHPLEVGRVRFRYGVYASTDAEIRNRVSLTASLRADVSSTTRGVNLSFRTSATYHSKNFAVRLSVANAFRELTYVEAAGRFVDPTSGLILLEGSPELRTPRVESAEVGVIWAPWSRLKLIPTVYFQRLSNLITENFRSLVRKTFVKLPQARWILGGEVEARWSATETSVLWATFSSLRWLDSFGTGASVGSPAQNSAFTAWLGYSNDWIDGRLEGEIAVGYHASKEYTNLIGSPPVFVSNQVPGQWVAEANVAFQPFERWPLRLWLKVQTSIPHLAVDSPAPAAATTGSVGMIGVEWRR